MSAPTGTNAMMPLNADRKVHKTTWEVGTGQLGISLISVEFQLSIGITRVAVGTFTRG